MDSQTTSPAAPANPSAAMFQNATIDKAKGNEFSNNAGDIFKFVLNNYHFAKEGENPVLESSDAVNHLLKAIPHFLAEIRKNDQSRSTVGESSASGAGVSDPEPQVVTTDHAPEGDPVDVIDIVPPEPSSLPVTSIADRYTRSMLKCLAGYPLYNPNPFSELSKEYPRNGVNVGDVGFVRGDGTFDFLFNVCPSNNDMINPPNLPDGFSLGTPHQSATRDGQPLLRNTSLFQKPITRKNSGEYICEGSEGAILELPDGAIEDEATNIRPFEKLAARHGVQWYEYTMTRGRKISNGSLYLITSSTKCTQWGTAVFDRPCAPGQGLRFDKKTFFPFAKSNSKYHWKGSRAFPTKVFNPNRGDAPNQCVFLRGYKIMIRHDIFDNLCNDQPDPVNMTRQRATRIRGGGGPDPTSKTLTGGGLFSRTTVSTNTKSDEVLHANFNPSLVHPSDLINASLLSHNPNAKVALTHDDVWRNLLRDNFPKLEYTTLINIARSYTNTIDEYDCVSLQKISDFINVHNRPLQITETLTLQGPLTIANDDYIPVPAKNSLTLPRELVERILLLLDTKDMLTCTLVNREFNEIVQSSTLLQYFLACKAAGVIDDPRSPLSYGERLEELLNREEAWRTLKPVFETTIKVNHQPSPVQLYSLTGGTVFLDDSNLKDLNYCHLPSSPQDNPRWNRIPGHGLGDGSPGIFVNFDTAIYEHDLIVNVISSDIGNQASTERYSLDLVLLKFSTGEYHPLACHPRIHVQRLPETRPRVMPTIVGDNLALMVHSRDGIFPDTLFIFDWKTGYKRLQHETTENAYSDLVFLSPEILLIPNSIQSHFEVWHLPPSHPNPTRPVQFLALQLPTISHDYSLFGVSCNGELNPFPNSMPYFPPRTFFPSPENSIISVNLYLDSLQETRSASYALIMPRRALLDAIQNWTSSLREQLEDLPIWLTNEVTVHKIADPDNGSVRLDAQSKLVSVMPHSKSPPGTPCSPTFSASPTSPTSRISANSGSSSISSGSSTTSSTTQYSFLQVQWADWGPPISRWFQMSEALWTTGPSSQRYGFLGPNPRDGSKLMINVADFNQHNFRRNTDMTARLRRGEGKNRGSNEKEKEQVKEEELEKFDHEGVFSQDVYMGLKCVVYHAPDEYDFDAVLMDDERLLGLKLNRDGNVESIKVLYFG